MAKSRRDGMEMTWKHGRQLASVKKGSSVTRFTYDWNGLRARKDNPDGTWTKYYVLGGRIVGEAKYGVNGAVQYSIRYTFDEQGVVTGYSYWGATDTRWWEYYFVRNLQGDVVQVYAGADNSLVASYTYDAWGNILTQSGSMASVNPFRYRGYMYDEETGFYYLQSRYYDPEIGRFINADGFVATGQGILGNNMFAYCLNNPVNCVDVNGASTAVLGVWSAGMSWLPFADTVLPIGDIIYLAGCLILVTVTPSSDRKQTPEISYDKAGVSPGVPSPKNDSDDDDDDLDDDYYNNEDNFAGRKKIGKSKGKTPGSNKAQNKQFNDATRGLTRGQRRAIHDDITGKGLGYHEIRGLAKGRINGPKYFLK